MLRSLEMRGVEFLKTVEQDRVQTLEEHIGNKLSSSTRSFYLWFPGFANYDPKSQFRLWGFSEVIERNQKREKGSLELLSVGDFLIESDEIVTELPPLNGLVKLLDEQRVLEKSLVHFLQSLSEGTFDIF